jgi:hypothetical protein
MVGSLISIIGMFLPWISSGGDSQTGTGIFLDSGFTIYEDPGAGVIVFAVITRGLGVALFFAGRILAVAISAIVVAEVCVIRRHPLGVVRGGPRKLRPRQRGVRCDLAADRSPRHACWFDRRHRQTP